MELTVESLIAELGLELASGHEAANTHVRWVHSTELVDPTPWLRGGELLLTTGMQLEGPKTQRELIDRLADHAIAGLGFGTGFAHKRLPAALERRARPLVPAVRGAVRTAVHRDHRACVRAAARASATKCSSATWPATCCPRR